MIRTTLAAALALALSAGAALAQAAPAPAPAAPATAPAAGAAAPAMKGGAKPRTAQSIECSKKADASNVHGKPRQAFMRKCKAGKA